MLIRTKRQPLIRGSPAPPLPQYFIGVPALLSLIRRALMLFITFLDNLCFSYSYVVLVLAVDIHSSLFLNPAVEFYLVFIKLRRRLRMTLATPAPIRASPTRLSVYWRERGKAPTPNTWLSGRDTATSITCGIASEWSHHSFLRSVSGKCLQSMRFCSIDLSKTSSILVLPYRQKPISARLR